MARQSHTVTVGDETMEFDSKKAMLKGVGEIILQQSQQPMTLRQLYYQFVGYDLIENKISQYQYLSKSVTEARIDGDISWDLIEDRTRGVAAGDWNDGNYVSPEARFRGNLRHFKETPDRFHRPRWMDQDAYVEVWVEKAALAGIFENVCDDLKVTTFPNRGYSSITLLKDAADRFRDAAYDGKEPYILYFGDFDPSGQDIERNIREKINDTFGVGVSVERVALNRQQIDDFELPPQPAKRTDARYEEFVEEHGDMAVELDALPPEELRRLIRVSVNDLFDHDLYENHIKEKEQEEREKLRAWINAVLDESAVGLD